MINRFDSHRRMLTRCVNNLPYPSMNLHTTKISILLHTTQHTFFLNTTMNVSQPGESSLMQSPHSPPRIAPSTSLLSSNGTAPPPILTTNSLLCFSFSLNLSPSPTMSTYDRHKPMSQKLHDSTPSSHQAVKFVTASAIGAGSLFLSGLILTGTVIGLAIATPLLVLFSPILVPAGIVTFLLATGFVFSGGFGVAAVSALSWIYNYAKGNHPVGADSLDQARMMVANTAWGVTEKAREVGQYVQHKAQEVTGFD